MAHSIRHKGTALSVAIRSLQFLDIKHERRIIECKAQLTEAKKLMRADKALEIIQYHQDALASLNRLTCQSRWESIVRRLCLKSSDGERLYLYGRDKPSEPYQFFSDLSWESSTFFGPESEHLRFIDSKTIFDVRLLNTTEHLSNQTDADSLKFIPNLLSKKKRKHPPQVSFQDIESWLTRLTSKAKEVPSMAECHRLAMHDFMGFSVTRASIRRAFKSVHGNLAPGPRKKTK